MRIIKRGTKQDDREYEVTCGRCGTEFAFLRSESKLESDHRLIGANCPTGRALVVKCPVCEKQVYRLLR